MSLPKVPMEIRYRTKLTFADWNSSFISWSCKFTQDKRASFPSLPPISYWSLTLCKKGESKRLVHCTAAKEFLHLPISRHISVKCNSVPPSVNACVSVFFTGTPNSTPLQLEEGEGRRLFRDPLSAVSTHPAPGWDHGGLEEGKPSGCRQQGH